MPLQSLRRALEPLIRRLMHVYWRFSRGATLGARAMVIDGQGRVFLVKHSYVAGWHLPGGGVETGETFLKALTRELAEEGNIAMTAPPVRQGGDDPRLPRGALRRARIPPGHPAAAQLRDHRTRFLCARRAAGRHQSRHPRAHRRGARRRGGERGVVRPTDLAALFAFTLCRARNRIFGNRTFALTAAAQDAPNLT